MKSKVLDVKECSACGEDHEGVEFLKLEPPVLIKGELHQYVGICPTTGISVFMQLE